MARSILQQMKADRKRNYPKRKEIVQTEHPHVSFRYELEARVAKDANDVEARQWLLALNGLIELAQKMGEQDDNLCYMNAWDVLEAVMLHSSKVRK